MPSFPPFLFDFSNFFIADALSRHDYQIGNTIVLSNVSIFNPYQSQKYLIALSENIERVCPNGNQEDPKTEIFRSARR
jgi:hypothetical protein